MGKPTHRPAERTPGSDQSWTRLGLVLLAGLALGSTTVATRIGVQELHPLTLVALRVLVGVAAFAIVLGALRRPLPRGHWRDLAVVGLANTAFPLVAFTIALQSISSGVLTIFLSLIPLFTALMAHVWLKGERLHGARLAGLLVALSGVVVLLATRTTGLNGGAPADLRGHALALAGALTNAFGAVYVRRRLSDVDPLALTAGQMLLSLGLLAPAALALGSLDFSGVTWRGWGAVAYMALVGSFLGFYVIYTLIRRYGATTGALPGYVVPVVAFGLGPLLLGEVVGPALLAGVALTLAGVFIANR